MSGKIPAGYTSVTPWIISRDTAVLLDFVKRAFGAQELARMNDADGPIVHAELRIGDAVVMAFDARPGWPETPGFLRLFVDDCDAVFQRALDAGASAVTTPTTLFFGDRVGRVRDPLGNIWWIQTHVEDVTPDEMQRRAGQRAHAEAMNYVQASLAKAMAR
jgi:PhnB protein